MHSEVRYRNRKRNVMTDNTSVILALICLSFRMQSCLISEHTVCNFSATDGQNATLCALHLLITLLLSAFRNNFSENECLRKAK